MKDSDQLMDFVPLVVALLTEQSSAVTDNFVALGIHFTFFFFKLFTDLFIIFLENKDGIKCVIKMISIHEEVVRVYCLKMVIYFLYFFSNFI